MEIIRGKLAGMYKILSNPHTDDRGMLARTYDRELYENHGLTAAWIQESFSHTARANTLRGLHVQLPPFTEGKLIHILRGTMRWVLVDLREESPTFGQWESIDLDGRSADGLYVERGFAHGCVSLSENCDLIIKSDNIYSEKNGVGIMYNDKELGIDWGITAGEPIISEAHKKYGAFDDFRKKYRALRVEPNE